MSDATLKYLIVTYAIVFVVYVIMVGTPFVREYLNLQEQDLNRNDYKKELKKLNQKYTKKLLPALILFIVTFSLAGLLVGD